MQSSVDAWRRVQPSGWDYPRAWDYVAPPEIALHCLNLPAAMLISVVGRKGTFQIGFEYSVELFVAYVGLIAMLWFAIGWYIGYGAQFCRARRSIGKSLSVVWILVGLLLLGIALLIMMFPGPLSMFIPLAALVWGAGLLFLARATLVWSCS